MSSNQKDTNGEVFSFTSAVTIQHNVQRVVPTNDTIWCETKQEQYSRPWNQQSYRDIYEVYMMPIQSNIDLTVVQHLVQTDSRQTTSMGSMGSMDWSFLYASLPVMRTTIVREPFSWLLSKYSWHAKRQDNKRKIPPCDDVLKGTQVKDRYAFSNSKATIMVGLIIMHFILFSIYMMKVKSLEFILSNENKSHAKT